MKIKQNIPYIVFGIGVAALAGATTYVLSESFRNSVGKMMGKKIGCNSKFLFVGDSNTSQSFSYADLLRQYCPSASVKKISKSSKNTKWMLDNYRDDIANGNKYDVVAIFGGSNDLGNPNQAPTYQNLDTMYKLAKDSGAVVVAVSPTNKEYLWGEQRFCPESQSNCHAFPEGIDRLNKLIAFIKANRTKDIFLDYNKITRNKDFLQSDMQHGNQAAHKALFQEFKQKVL